MKHYWINIDRNTERYEFMTEQFNRLGLEHHRVSAYTPADFDSILEQKRPLTCKHPGCSNCEAEFACLCSHMKAIEEGMNSGDSHFVVLEDDTYLPFILDYDSLVKDIPEDAEILQMLISYGETVLNLYKYHMYTNQKYIKWQYLLPSAGFYIVSKQGAKKLVDMFRSKITGKYDFSSSPHQIVTDVLLYQTVNSYATTHPYAFPNIKMGSEIHTDHLEAHERAIKDIKSIVKMHNIKPFPFVLKTNDANDHIL
jgi:GR25 family glycosyltransferase involved in LPS biosynthesis